MSQISLSDTPNAINTTQYAIRQLALQKGAYQTFFLSDRGLEDLGGGPAGAQVTQDARQMCAYSQCSQACNHGNQQCSCHVVCALQNKRCRKMSNVRLVQPRTAHRSHYYRPSPAGAEADHMRQHHRCSNQRCSGYDCRKAYARISTQASRSKRRRQQLSHSQADRLCCHSQSTCQADRHVHRGARSCPRWPSRSCHRWLLALVLIQSIAIVGVTWPKSIDNMSGVRSPTPPQGGAPPGRAASRMRRFLIPSGPAGSADPEHPARPRGRSRARARRTPGVRGTSAGNTPPHLGTPESDTPSNSGDEPDAEPGGVCSPTVFADTSSGDSSDTPSPAGAGPGAQSSAAAAAAEVPPQQNVYQRAASSYQPAATLVQVVQDSPSPTRREASQQRVRHPSDPAGAGGQGEPAGAGGQREPKDRTEPTWKPYVAPKWGADRPPEEQPDRDPPPLGRIGIIGSNWGGHRRKSDLTRQFMSSATVQIAIEADERHMEKMTEQFGVFHPENAAPAIIWQQRHLRLSQSLEKNWTGNSRASWACKISAVTLEAVKPPTDRRLTLTVAGIHVNNWFARNRLTRIREILVEAEQWLQSHNTDIIYGDFNGPEPPKHQFGETFLFLTLAALKSVFSKGKIGLLTSNWCFEAFFRIIVCVKQVFCLKISLKSDILVGRSISSKTMFLHPEDTNFISRTHQFYCTTFAVFQHALWHLMYVDHVQTA